MISQYTKAILAAFIAAGGAAVTSLQDGAINANEWVAIAVTFVVAGGGVFAVPNVPESVRVYGKLIVAGATAGLGSLGTALTDGIVTPAEIITMVTALVVGSGLVGIAPNAAASDGPIPGDLVLDPEYDPYADDEAEHDDQPDVVPDVLEAQVPDLEMPDGFEDGADLVAKPQP